MKKNSVIRIIKINKTNNISSFGYYIIWFYVLMRYTARERVLGDRNGREFLF